MPEPTSRRSFLFRLALAGNAVAAMLVGVPLLGYLLAPVRRLADQAWIPLGAPEGFSEGQTRLATYRNPFAQAWDGKTADVACWVRRLEGEAFQVFAVNCAHLG